MEPRRVWPPRHPAVQLTANAIVPSEEPSGGDAALASWRRRGLRSRPSSLWIDDVDCKTAAPCCSRVSSIQNTFAVVTKGRFSGASFLGSVIQAWSTNVAVFPRRCGKRRRLALNKFVEIFGNEAA